MAISRRRVLVGTAAAAAGAVVAPNLLAGSAQAAAVPMAVSSGKVDITPTADLAMAGYGVDSPRLAQGSNAPLFARCTIFWDNGFPNVIVTADVLAFPRSMHQAIRSRVVPLGIANSDFILTATHTHNGPVLIDELNPYISYNIQPGSDVMNAVESYSAELEDTIVSLVSSTLGAVQIPCTLDYQVANENFAYNREGLPYVEVDVPVLVARSTGGSPLAVLFGYGCHPVSAGGQTLFDPDYPGVACSLLENATGAFAQFLTGPAGDQDPPVNGRDWPLSQSLGSDLGQTVINAIATPGRSVSGPISTAYQEVSLPLDITDTPANLAAVRADYVVRQTSTTAGYTGYYQRHAEVMIGQIDAHSFQTAIPLPLQTWNLPGASGPLDIALTGGELVSGYGVYFRNRHGGSNGIWVAGYANEIPTYIPSDELLASGGALHYACGWDVDFPGIAGGAMSIYGWLGHFYRPPSTASTSPEQIIIDALTTML